MEDSNSAPYEKPLKPPFRYHYTFDFGKDLTNAVFGEHGIYVTPLEGSLSRAERMSIYTQLLFIEAGLDERHYSEFVNMINTFIVNYRQKAEEHQPISDSDLERMVNASPGQLTFELRELHQRIGGADYIQLSLPLEFG